MKIFLRLKHWQLFIIWIISEIIFITTINTSIWILTILIFGFTVAGWIYSIGKIANGSNVKSKIDNYKEDLWLVLYLFALIPFGFIFRNIEQPGSLNILITFCAGIIGFISVIKLIIFAAKNLKQYETKKNLKFSDYSKEFFLIMFFIIGIWIIQPRLNNMNK